MTGNLRADGFPEQEIRARAREGAARAFPPGESYGTSLWGASPETGNRAADPIDRLRLVPPVFMPRRLERLIELGREPLYSDVVLDSRVGGFRSPLPVYLSAIGSTQVASADLGVALSRQAGALGLPMVIGENIVPAIGFGRLGDETGRAMTSRIRAYLAELPDDVGGVVVQQSTEDADAEVWNLVYSDPEVQPLLDSGRLAFELKVGQGAKPGLGGMTVLDDATASSLADRFALDPALGVGLTLRSASPGTFTEEILRQQIRLMRNNFPRARVWVKLPPGRDVAEAAALAWEAGADAVTIDGAEGGTGWAPNAFLTDVGLPLGECLARIDRPAGDLLASGRMGDGARAVKTLALGATAVGLGRAAFLAVDEDPADGLVRLVECLALEMKLLISALGKYEPAVLGREDLWWQGAELGHEIPAPS